MRLINQFIIRPIFAIVFIVLSSLAMKALYDAVNASQQKEILWFLLGGALLCAISFRFFKNQWLYVFAHEAAHWLTAKAFRRKTGRFHVSLNGGAVEIENPNIAITLAPYFLPTLCILLLPIYPVATRIIQPTGWNEQAFFAIMGYFFMHHAIHTGKAITKEQPDLLRYGYFFSLSLIIFCNTLLLCVLYPAFTSDISSTYQILSKSLIQDINLLWQKALSL